MTPSDNRGYINRKNPKTWNETKTKILILRSKYGYDCSLHSGVKHKEQMPKHKRRRSFSNSCNIVHILERFVYLQGNYNVVCIKRARDNTQDEITSALNIKNVIPKWYISINKFKFNVHGSVYCNNILIYIQQDATLHSLFYLETALHVSGGTITHHQEHKQLYLQHLVFVTRL